MKKKEVGLVVKSNALSEASYRLTPAEQGVILSCISQIRKDERVTDQTMYKISVSDYADLMGADPFSAYRDVKNAAIRLSERRVRIYNLPNGEGKIKNKNEVLITGWVQSIIYSDDGGEVSLRFSHDMLPYLTNLSKCFTKYKLKSISKMSSGYGIRLYEIIIGWLNQYKKESHEVSIEWIRKIFMLEEKYPRMHDLKKRVIEPAISDINMHSDLLVTWKLKKTGRKATHIEFIYKPKVNQSNKKSKQQNLESWKSHIEKHARPGESYAQTDARLKSKLAKI